MGWANGVSDAAPAGEKGAVLRREGLRRREMLADNYAIMNAANGTENTGCFRWHLQLLPRLTVAAGFELGTGIAVNPTPPEQAAERLRQAATSPPSHGGASGSRRATRSGLL